MKENMFYMVRKLAALERRRITVANCFEKTYVYPNLGKDFPFFSIGPYVDKLENDGHTCINDSIQIILHNGALLAREKPDFIVYRYYQFREVVLSSYVGLDELVKKLSTHRNAPLHRDVPVLKNILKFYSLDPNTRNIILEKYLQDERINEYLSDKIRKLGELIAEQFSEQYEQFISTYCSIEDPWDWHPHVLLLNAYDNMQKGIVNSYE